MIFADNFLNTAKSHLNENFNDFPSGMLKENFLIF
jgi:hypothetical protein